MKNSIVPAGAFFSLEGAAVGDVTGDGSPEIVGADGHDGVVVLHNTLHGQPQAGLPSAPTLDVPDSSFAGVSLTWSVPADDGGSVLTGYRLDDSATRLTWKASSASLLAAEGTDVLRNLASFTP